MKVSVYGLYLSKFLCFLMEKNALYKHQKLKNYCVKPLGSSFRPCCSWWLAEPCLVHGCVSSALGPRTVRATTHVIFMMFICGLPVSADLCWLVPPDSISSPRFWRRACRHRVGLWSERVDALQTGSHTRCLCTKRKKKCWKKALFFSPLHPDSALWSTLLSLHLSFPSTSEICVSAALSSLLSPTMGKHFHAQRQADTTCSFRCHRRSPSLGEWNETRLGWKVSYCIRCVSLLLQMQVYKLFIAAITSYTILINAGMTITVRIKL